MNDTTIDKKKTYTFVFSSIAGTVSGNPNLFFNVDWSIMPNQPYNITFTYLSEVNTIDGTTIPMVYADFLAATNVYNAGSSTARTQAITSNFLGLLKYKLIGANSFLYADNDTNPPIYIASRPMNNQLNIQILNNNGVFYAPQAPDLGQWVLTMHFTPADQPLRI
jgi:hypothetical protein